MTEALLHIRLLVDFGCVVMIWMVQLVVYPSFLYFAQADLYRWHERYTKSVTAVVFPLMTGQILLAFIQLAQIINAYTLFSMLIVLLLWLSTFAYFVPLHNSIQAGHYELQKVKKLVSGNWFRTILWSLLFVWTLFYFSFSG